VHDLSSVRDHQGFGNLARDVDGAIERQPLAHHVAQAAALHELHRDVAPVLALAGFVNGDDIRMVQSRHGQGFADEAIDSVGFR
jgi:hypothetical protein